MNLQPIVLSHAQPSTGLRLPIEYACLQAQRFWALYGYQYDVAPVRFVQTALPINLTAGNPHNQVLVALQAEDIPSTLEEPTLTWLEGWDSMYRGWGSPLGAVVGEYALRSLRTGSMVIDERFGHWQTGSPEDIADDWPGHGLACHEIGHILGLGHSTGESCIMSISGACYRFPHNVVLTQGWEWRPEALARMRLMRLRHEPVGCRLEA